MDSKIKIWDIVEGTCKYTLDAVGDDATIFCTLGGGGYFVTGHEYGNLRVWKLSITTEGHILFYTCQSINF